MPPDLDHHDAERVGEAAVSAVYLAQKTWGRVATIDGAAKVRVDGHDRPVNVAKWIAERLERDLARYGLRIVREEVRHG